MAPGQNSMVLEVRVVGVEILGKRTGNVAMGPVVVELQSRIGRPRKRVRPAPHRVAATYCDISRARLGDPAVVEIPLQRQLARLRRDPIQPNTTLPRVPIVNASPAVGELGLVASERFTVRAVVNV